MNLLEALHQFNNDLMRVRFKVSKDFKVLSQNSGSYEYLASFLSAPRYDQEPNYSPNDEREEAPYSRDFWIAQEELAYREERASEQHEIKKRRELRWYYYDAPRYIAVRPAEHIPLVSFFKVEKLTDKAFLLENGLWIPFSVVTLCLNRVLVRQSNSIDFTCCIMNSFLEKHPEFLVNIYLGLIPDALLLDDLDQHEYYEILCECWSDQDPDTDYLTRKALRDKMRLFDSGSYGQLGAYYSIRRRNEQYQTNEQFMIHLEEQEKGRRRTP